MVLDAEQSWIKIQEEHRFAEQQILNIQDRILRAQEKAAVNIDIQYLLSLDDAQTKLVWRI